MSDPNSFVLELLRCPITHSKLRMLDSAELSGINKAIASGNVEYSNGQKASEQIESGLVNAEKTFAFSIRGEILQLIADDAIAIGDII